jgi:hypothetical protein
MLYNSMGLGSEAFMSYDDYSTDIGWRCDCLSDIGK